MPHFCSQSAIAFAPCGRRGNALRTYRPPHRDPTSHASAADPRTTRWLLLFLWEVPLQVIEIVCALLEISLPPAVLRVETERGNCDGWKYLDG